MEVMALSVRLKEEGASTVKSAIDKLKGSMKDLNLTSVLAGAGLGVLVKQAVDMADQMRLLEGRLKLVTNSASELQVVQDALRESANRTRSDYAASVELFARVARSTRDLGIAQQDLLRFTELTQMAIKTSGATSVEASAALIQLSQGLAAGALRGDEFRSVMEQIPAVAQAIAAGMGITIGELRAMSMQGELTAQQVIDAILKMEKTIRGDFASAPVTVADAFVVLRNQVRDTLAEIDAATGATSALAQVIGKIGPAVAAFGSAIADIVRMLRELQPLIIAFGAAWAAVKLPMLVSLVGALGTTVFALAGRLSIATVAQNALNVAMNMNPVGVLITGFGALTAIVLGFADATRRAAEARDEEIANSEAYKNALAAAAQRRKDLMAVEEQAAEQQKANDAAQAGRQDDLIKLATLTRLNGSELRELISAEAGYATALQMGTLPLNQRIVALEKQRELQDAILSAQERMMATRTAGLGAGAGSTVVAPLSVTPKVTLNLPQRGGLFDPAVLAEAQAAVNESAAQLRDTLATSLGNSIGDGIAAGFERGFATGRIGEGFKALAGTLLSGLGSAMIQFGMAGKGFATLIAKFKAAAGSLNAPATIAASLALIAGGAALKGVAQAAFGGMGGGGGGGSAMVTPVTPFGIPMTGQGSTNQIIFGQTSATTAAGMTPRSATNVTIIGPDDPKAQRAIEELIRKGQTRGTLG